MAASKQDASIQALYENERAAQEFLANVDGALVSARNDVLSADEAVNKLQQSGILEGAEINGTTISKSFENSARKLNVMLAIRDDLNYQVISWRTEAKIDTNEEVTLWHGNNA